MALIWYGAASDVPWLYLLAAWVLSLAATGWAYAAWNGSGLRLHLEALESRPAESSPTSDLAMALLRSAPSAGPLFEGDGIAVALGIDTTGRARGPAWLSGALNGEALTAATGLVPRAGWRAQRELRELHRGPVSATGWAVGSSDPLGFFRGRRACGDSEVALVLPRFSSLAGARHVREVEAALAAPRSGSGTELFGVRDYRPGDPRRRIHWRSSARLGQLVVREFEPPGALALGIFCDPAPASPEVADQIARIAASEAWDCIREGGRVVLWGPGLEPCTTAASRSFWVLLEWLARYPSFAAAGAPDAPVVSEAVAVAGSPNADLATAAEAAQRRGARVRAWIVGPGELAIDAPTRRVGTGWPL